MTVLVVILTLLGAWLFTALVWAQWQAGIAGMMGNGAGMGGMMRMMSAMDSPEAQKMMAACHEFMHTMHDQPAQNGMDGN